MAERKTLCVIDGHSQIFRAYYAPFRDLTSPTGEPTRATYVFCSMLLKFLANRSFDYLAMAIDGPAADLQRRKLYSEYKVNRKPVPDDFHPQAERIIEIVRAAGIPVLAVPGQEADDVMASLVEQFGDTTDIVLVSRDKDLDQLVNNHVVLYDPMKDETFDADAIETKKGYRPEQAIEIQTLTGDSTDNIPGVPGIGPKTAVKLIQKYGTAAEVLAHADELTPKQRENVLTSAEMLDLSRQLVTLRRDVPLDLALDDLAYTGVNGSAIRDIFAELGFNKLFDQLDALGVGGQATVSTQDIATKGGMTSAADFTYHCIDTPEAFDALIQSLQGITELAIDTETTAPRPMWADLVGISLARQPGEGYYLPIKGPLGAVTLDMDMVRERLGPILADESITKVGYNFKYDLIVLDHADLPVAGPMFDAMIAAYVLDASRPSYKMDTLAAEMLNHKTITYEDVVGRGKTQTTIDASPVEIVTQYAGEDADITLRLANHLRPLLAAEQLVELYESLELPLMPVLAEMEQTGICVDPQRLKQMEVAMSSRIDALRDSLFDLAGEEFNPDSPKQLAVILFDKLGLPVIKKKKTGPSTDASVLEELAIEHELPGKLLDYRKLTKLLGTYLKSLAGCIHPRTGRVHTSFHQTGTETGRLSSSDPNLQNIPIRSEEGRQIRSAFVAPKGHLLLAADYSQVELRILAHMCADETMLATFADDADIHRIVAAEVFDVAPEEVTDDQRSSAKAVNFGIIYGQTAFGLSKALRIPRFQAAEFIERYHARFPRIEEFLQTCIAQAKANGYVETLLGRRRRIPEIDAANPQRRAAAERLAINSVVQGSAADLIKRAMLNIATRIHAEQRPSRMLLQIHDELVFEIPADDIEAEKDFIISEMAGAIDLAVPVKVDVGIGANWLEAK